MNYDELAKQYGGTFVGSNIDDLAKQYGGKFVEETKPVEPTTGFTGAFGSSVERLKGQGALLAGKVGIMDPAEAEKYYREQEKKAGAFKPTEKGWGEAPLTKVAELAGQSIPYMVAPIVAGAAGAVAAPELAVAGLGAGTLAAFGTSAGQFTASNLGRQMDTGKSLADTNLLKAGAAAIPQAALDTISMKMAPGIGRIFESAGIKLTQDTAEQIAKKGLLANAGELAYATGKHAGTEGLTESAQQVFERLQAGLNITNEEARKEYFENFIGGAVLGGTIGGAGHVYEKAFPKTDKPETQPNAPAVPKTYLNEETDYKHPVHNPTGMFTAAELGDVAQQVNNVREAEGKPLLRSFSIEDLHDAKIGQDVIDGLVAAKTGYQGQEVTPQTVIDAAQNIDTSSKGFTDFLARTTGKSNLTEMTPPELHAAVTALNGLQGITELPEGTNSHAFKRSDYDQAIQNLSGSLQTNPFMGPTSVIHEIKTSLNTSDEIADQILKAALRNKELTITTTPHYDLTDAEGKVVFSTPVKAVADSAASKHGLNVIESSSEAIHLPTTEIKSEDLEGPDAPAEYELRAGNQLLDRFKSEDDAFTKAQEFQKVRATRKAAARDERIEALAEVDADAKKIEEMAALGKRDTPEYEQAVAKAEAKAEQSMAKAKALELEQLELDAPVSVLPYTAKAVFNREAQGKALDLAKDLHPQLKRFGLENVSLRVVDSIRNGTADGEYAQNLITIAMDADNPLGVLRHESIHALKELGAFTDAEWKVLTERARKEWIPKYIQETGLYDEYYKQYTSQTGSDAGFQEYIEEEAIAEAFKHFSVKPPAGLLGNLVYRLKQFFAALKAAFKKQGFNTADSIFGRIEEGKVRPTLAPGTSNGKYSIISLTEALRKKEEKEDEDFDKTMADYQFANQLNKQEKALKDAYKFINENKDTFEIAQKVKDLQLFDFDSFAEKQGVRFYDIDGLDTALNNYKKVYSDADKIFQNWQTLKDRNQLYEGGVWANNIDYYLKDQESYIKSANDYVDAVREYQKTANKKSAYVRRELAELNKILPPVTELKVKKTKAKQQEGQVLPFVRPQKFERFSLRSERDASDTFGAGAKRVKYTDEQSNGTIEVVVRSDGSASVLNLEVPEEFRGKGFGKKLQAKILEDFPKMQGQVSSKAAAKTAYDLGRRPPGKPNATLEDVFKSIDKDSSVNLVSPDMQGRFSLRGVKAPEGTNLKAATVGLTEERINDLVREYGYTDGRFKAEVVYVKPQEFLDAVADRAYQTRLKEETEKYGKPDFAQYAPMNLQVRDGKIVNHEGRHRALELVNAGVDKVAIVLYRNDGSLKRFPKVLSPQDQGAHTGFKSLHVENAIPTTYENLNKLKETFVEKPEVRYSLRAPQTEAFKKWFGKSKIVDSNGEPKVMYHGTARDITEFKPKQADAIFLTPDPEFAAKFAGMSEDYMENEFYKNLSSKEKQHLFLLVMEENKDNYIKDYGNEWYEDAIDTIKYSQSLYTSSGIRTLPTHFGVGAKMFTSDLKKKIALNLESRANIMPVYVRAENPFDYENKRHYRILLEDNDLDESVLNEMMHGDWETIESDLVQEAIQNSGFDGFYIKENGVKNLAVYESNQIKSATGNIGTYDINNPDIRFSLRAPDTKEFKKFFGNSKVVDKDGNPEVLYHGTTNDFSEFDNLYTIGQHFGTAKAANDRLKHIAYKRRMQGFKNLKEAEGIPEGANIMPVFVSLQNPLQAEDVGNWMDSANIAVDNSENKQLSKNARKKLSELADELEDERSQFDLEELPYEDFSDEDGNPAPVPDWANNWTVSDENRRALREIRYILEEDGFDGIVYTNDVEDKGKKSYIVFDSENVKSATGNIGTYDKEFRDVRFSIRAQVSPAITARVDTVSPARVEKGFVERILLSVFPESAAKFRIGYINALEGIERQTKAKAEQFGNLELLADVSALAAANQSQRAAGIAAAAFQHGVPVYSRGRTTVSDLNGSVKGLLDVLQPLMALKDPEVFRYFQFYAGVKRGQRLLRSGKEKLFEQADAQKGRDLERQFPVFRQVFDDFQAYNKGQVKYMRDTGVISPAEERIWTQNWDYIPFYRQLDDEVTQGPKIFSSISGVAKPKELTGSAQYVVYDANGNEVGAYKQQAEANQHAARVNGTVQLEGTPLADFIETVVRNSRAAIEAGLKNEACRRAIRDSVALGTATRLPNVQAGTDVINYKENGKTVYYRVHDPLLVESLKGLNLPQVPMLGLFTGPARILREAVTKTPDFGIVNLMRDSLSTWITSGSKMTPIVDSFKQAGKILANRSPEAVELAKMGLGGYDFQGDVKASAEEFTKELRARTGNRTKAEQALLPISKFWDMLEKGSYASDMATRVEVYKRVLADTGNEAEAWHQALEILNFSRRGNSQFIRVLSAIVPFLNARIQGLDVLYRSGFGQAAMVNKEEMRKAFWIRSLILLGLTGMYWAMVHDDDEYKKLTNEERDNYWIIPGLTVNGRPFRFPIPFELGTIFKVFPERILEATLGQDTNQDFMKAFKRNVMSNLSFNPVPVAALPIMENWFNYSVFTDRPVVGRGLEGLAPEAQYTSSTSEFAKDLGKIIGYSPIKIDHLIRGYTGNMGMYATSMLDTVLASQDDPVRATKRFEQLPVIKRFFSTDSGSIEAFYALKGEVDETVRTVNNMSRTNPQELKEYLDQKHLNLYGLRSYINVMSNYMDNIRAARNAINLNKNLTADEKQERLERLHQAEVKVTENIRALRKRFEQPS